MGKSQKPLSILIYGAMGYWEEIQALAGQGHTLTIVPIEHDVILGPTCWLMDEAHRKYLPLALAEARKRRYPKESREQSE